jgi:hypothetical protein
MCEQLPAGTQSHQARPEVGEGMVLLHGVSKVLSKSFGFQVII